MINKIVNPQAVAWVICAEGSITIGSTYNKRVGRTYYNTNVKVYNSEKEFIELFHELVGFCGKVSGFFIRQKRWKPQYQWGLYKRDEVKQFLLEILPYLPIKVLQARTALEFLETGNIELVDYMRQLNERGVRND